MLLAILDAVNEDRNVLLLSSTSSSFGHTFQDVLSFHEHELPNLTPLASQYPSVAYGIVTFFL